MKTESGLMTHNKISSSDQIHLLPQYKRVKIFCLATLFSTVLFTACNKQDLNQPKPDIQIAGKNESNAETDFLKNCTNLSKQTFSELKEAHAATARYQDINNAIADGFVDINVVMPNMGYHFEKISLVDSVFDVRHPELLVYNKTIDGRFKLVAVEYAVPLDKSVSAPGGFTGNADVWDHNTDFGLWLLHAWVWKFNPDGIFNPTNPNVHVL